MDNGQKQIVVAILLPQHTRGAKTTFEGHWYHFTVERFSRQLHFKHSS